MTGGSISLVAWLALGELAVRERPAHAGAVAAQDPQLLGAASVVWNFSLGRRNATVPSPAIAVCGPRADRGCRQRLATESGATRRCDVRLTRDRVV